MLRQYFEAKAAHPGVLMAIRVGDFYEFYGEDAEIAARALEITLTGREDGANGRVPMAGVPHHSVEKYLARLLAQGMKVGLCDQMEDPKLAKGLVRREVTRVLTPGTLVEDAMLSEGASNFLAAICVLDGRAGLAVLEPSTGEFLVTEIEGEAFQDRLLQELARIRPAELLAPERAMELGELARQGLGVRVTGREPMDFERSARQLLGRLRAGSLAAFGVADKPASVAAAAMILGYAEQNGLTLDHLDGLTSYSIDGFLEMNVSTRRSLELTQNLADGTKRHTLLSVLDETMTPMGARLLRRWVEQPLLDRAAIEARHDAVGRLVEAALPRADLRAGLRKLADIERLVGRCATGLAGPRDLAALRSTLIGLPDLADPLRRLSYGRIQELREAIGDHAELAYVLDRAVVSDPPHLLRDGGVIRDGYDPELDKLRSLQREGRAYIAQLEAQERVRTGIPALKVGFNSVFGYYLEISKAHAERAPGHYVRKQTTANAERYITAELKEHETAVLGAGEKAVALEMELFARLRARVTASSSELLRTARALAELDALAAFGEAAVRRDYRRPEIADEDVLEIVQGRHPVVEASQSGFAPNDLGLGAEAPRLIVLTGPNMSGKSTYLRQTALIVLMAQIGSFVPAERCRMGLCDRVFARIGAKDEIAMGQSTFMVEMVESAHILHHATERSLVILDEVGRGTSTYDGLAIAWAMAERLAGLGAKTLFATHYHQMNRLADQVAGVANFRVGVEEVGDQIVWTHRVLPGGTDRSYGVHVARMAGMPQAVMARAAEVLADFEQTERPPQAGPQTKRLQLSLFEAEDPEVLRALREVDVERMTPLQAIQLLGDWKRRFGG
jgi:DNA mismatch repair protein MutS